MKIDAIIAQALLHPTYKKHTLIIHYQLINVLFDKIYKIKEMI